LSNSTQKSEAIAAEGARFAEFGRSRLERWMDALDGDSMARLRWREVLALRAAPTPSTPSGAHPGARDCA
jgi:hypothetical protein